jgi:3'(2'), 5'-bisphosphate nucleotidase
MEWDIAARHALIKASGGNIVDINGNELVYQKKNFQNPHFCAYSRYFPIFT